MRNSIDNDNMAISVRGMGSLTIGHRQVDINEGAEIAIRPNGTWVATENRTAAATTPPPRKGEGRHSNG